MNVHAPPWQRPTHLHVQQVRLANQCYALLCRDYRRATRAAAAYCAAGKPAVSHRYAHDATAHYAVKALVCDLIIDAAERRAATTGYELGPPDR